MQKRTLNSIMKCAEKIKEKKETDYVVTPGRRLKGYLADQMLSVIGLCLKRSKYSGHGSERRGHKRFSGV